MKGRKPKTIARPSGALTKAPPPPAWLGRHAKTEWSRVMPSLFKNGTLSAHELAVCESYCITVGQIRECEAIIQKKGMTYVGVSGDEKRRPETTLRREAIESARRLAAEIGLTPASRSKIKVEEVEVENESDFGIDI